MADAHSTFMFNSSTVYDCSLLPATGQPPLAGAVVCCTSLDIADRDEIHKHAQFLGAAKCTFDLTMDVSHLVIGHTNSAKYKFVAKNSPNVEVVLPDFIEALRIAWMNAQEVDLDKYHEQYRAPVFYKLRISLTGFTERKMGHFIVTGILTYRSTK